MVRELQREGQSLRAIGGALLEAEHQPRRAKRRHVVVVARLTDEGGTRAATSRSAATAPRVARA